MCEAKRAEGMHCGRRSMVLVRRVLGADCEARRRARWAMARGSMVVEWDFVLVPWVYVRDRWSFCRVEGSEIVQCFETSIGRSGLSAMTSGIAATAIFGHMHVNMGM